MVQAAYDVVEFRYIPEMGGRSHDPAGLLQYGRDKIHPSVELRAVAVTEFARSASGKHQHFISLMSEAER
jgi:hypothetical protein